jgi:23S rRNA (guanosine2251-2'-O)-methyltransferase
MSTRKKEIYLILQNIRSLFNIGSMFRSADAFAVKKIFLCGYSAYPIDKQITKIAKTALGAEKTVPFEHCWQTATLIKNLKKQKINIVALELTKDAVPLNKFKPKFPLAIIVGNEVTGITKAILKQVDKIVFIPMQGAKESLNVAIATSIALHEVSEKRK